MPELRLDPLRRRWIVTGKRPPMPDALDSGSLCAFCPGNERFTPKSITERLNSQGQWESRVFHDRAPLFRVEGGPGRQAEGLFDHMNAMGAHEIVVESRRHGATMGELAVDEIAQVIGIWRERILDLKRDHRLRYVSIFKRQMDASSGHEGHGHSQILAAPIVPPMLEMEYRWSLFHYERKERCLCCDIIQQERHDAKRVIDETADFISLCPYASRMPYEMWVMPLQHASSFEEDMDDTRRMAALSAFLKSSLQRVENLSRSLQLTVHTEPNLDAQGPTKDWWNTLPEDYHWHIEIAPQMQNDGELFSLEGFHFNPIPAEEAATVLRALEPRPPGAPRAT
jgi:UDPglucose--hexose-1-phosphate uridylyltransferase